MKYLFACLFFLWTTPANADALQIAGNGLILMDCHQTMQIAGHPEIYTEVGLGKIFLGSHPTKKRVLVSCGGWLLGTNLISHYLPEKWRKVFWIGIIGGHGKAVGNNWTIGLRFNF